MTKNEQNYEGRPTLNIITQFGYNTNEKEISYGKELTLQWNDNLPTLDIPLVEGPVRKTKNKTKAKTQTKKTTRKSTKSDNDEMTH